MLKELSNRDKEWRKIALKIVSYYNASNAEKKSLADDLVQNMYIKVYEQGKQWYEIKNSVEFYVYIVIRNLFYNYVREQKRFVRIDNKECSFDIVDDVELMQLFNEQLNTLRPLHKELLIMNKGEGISMRKLEAKYNISLNDIFKSCKTAKQILINRFFDTYNEFKN